MAASYSDKLTGDFLKACISGDKEGIMTGLNNPEVDLNIYDIKGKDFLMIIALSERITDENRADLLKDVLHHPRVSGNKELLGPSNIQNNSVFSPIVGEVVPTDGDMKNLKKKNIALLYSGFYEVMDGMAPPAANKDVISTMIGEAIHSKKVEQEFVPVGSRGVGGVKSEEVKPKPSFADIPPVGSLGVGGVNPVKTVGVRPVGQPQKVTPVPVPTATTTTSTANTAEVSGAAAVTSALFVASRNGNVEEVLRLLDNPDARLTAPDIYGKDFLMTLAMSKNIPQGKLAETMQKVLSHPKVKGNTALFTTTASNKKNIVDLYKGVYEKDKEPMSAPVEDKDTIALMVSQAAKGMEVTGKVIGGASGAMAKKEKSDFMQKHKNKIALFCGGVALFLGAKFFMSNSAEEVKKNDIINGIAVEYVETGKADSLTSFLGGKGKIVTMAHDNNPDTMYVPAGVAHPGAAPSIDNDFSDPAFENDSGKKNILPEYGSDGAIESILNKMAENPIHWEALNKLYAKGNLNVEIVEENNEISGYKAHIGDRSGTIYIEDIARWHEKWALTGNLRHRTDLDDPTFLAFSVVAKVHMDNALSSPELLGAMKENYSNITNAQKLAYAHGKAMAMSFLAEHDMLDNAYFINDRLGGNKYAMGIVLDAEGKERTEVSPDISKEKSPVKIYKQAFIASFLSGMKTPNTHRAFDAIINMWDRTDTDYANGLIFGTPWKMGNKGKTLTQKEIVELMPESIQKDLEGINVEQLMKMPDYLRNVRFKEETLFSNAWKKVADKAQKMAGVEVVSTQENNSTIEQMVKNVSAEHDKDVAKYQKSKASKPSPSSTLTPVKAGDKKAATEFDIFGAAAAKGGR